MSLPDCPHCSSVQTLEAIAVLPALGVRVCVCSCCSRQTRVTDAVVVPLLAQSPHGPINGRVVR